MLQSRSFKILGPQAPIFVLLVFSLLSFDVNVSMFGISASGVKGLREVLLAISATIGLAAYEINRDLGLLNEMLRGFIESKSTPNSDVREFLEVRYGVAELSSFRSFSNELKSSWYQITLAGLWVLCAVLMLVLIVSFALSVQFLILREIYVHPNFSLEVSLLVILYVLLSDLLSLIGFVRFKMIQPYRSN